MINLSSVAKSTVFLWNCFFFTLLQQVVLVYPLWKYRSASLEIHVAHSIIMDACAITLPKWRISYNPLSEKKVQKLSLGLYLF